MDIKKDVDLKRIMQDLSNEYFLRGASGYSGRELEILFVDLIFNLHPEIKSKSLFDQTRLFKVSETKLRNIMYEIKLRKNHSDEELTNILEKKLHSFEFKNDKVIFEIDDLYFRKRVENILSEKKFLSDSSFNSKIIKMPFAGYLCLIEHLLESSSSRKLKIEDIARAKDLMQKNREMLGKIKIPNTDISAKDVFSLTHKLIKSIEAGIKSHKK